MVSAGGLTLESVSITHAPNKTEYATGDTFDKTGMVVTANFNNDVSFVTTDYTVSPETLTAAVTAVTISVTVDGVTRTTTQAVTVMDKTEIAYTGAHTTKTIRAGGTEYILYTLTGSGTLTLTGKAAQNVGIWLCGGGNSSSTNYGGGGGYFAQNTAYTMAAGTYVVTIGAAKGTTSISKDGTNILTANGSTSQNGGSGGGGAAGYRGNTYAGGTGAGTSTRPFGDSTNFPQLPCAGGGGGSQKDESSQGNGGAGGSNGAEGSRGGTASVGTTLVSAAGGATGGGAGRISNSTNANATYYGSGSGGRLDNNMSSGLGGTVPSGYQGVMFIRVPV